MAEPQDEFARQRALDTYRIVDTPPDAAFDDIARLASALCDAPVALVSLIDRDRQWFKARQGFDDEQTARDVAFCDHAIREPSRMMEINDATRDARFADNPYVVGEDHVRFYAGVPLVTPGGAAIGTLCVLDREPRELTEVQRAGMASLARLAMYMLEARHRELELQRTAALVASNEAAAKAAAAAAAPAAPAATRSREPEPLGFTVAIFEVQNLAEVTKRIGDRFVARALEQVQEALQATLRPGSTDTVSHATGSPEMIVVLHGNHTAAGLQKLRDRLPDIERDTGFRLLSASADSATPQERVEMVFLRADEALTRAKDAARGRPAA
jgi:GAF domain-containing protein